MAWRKSKIDEKSRFRLVPWIAVAGLVLMLIGLGVVIEDLLRTKRNAFHPDRASGDIVLVTIDDHSLRAMGRWPWPRRYHAQLIDRLTAAGAKRIFFDIVFETRSDPTDDRLLAQAIERSKRVTLPLRGSIGEGSSLEQPRPLEMFSRHAQLGTIGIRFNYQNAIWHLPYGAEVDGKALPSFAASLAGAAPRTGEFPVDYSIDPKTIPTVHAEHIIGGRFDPRRIAGKDVIIGVNTDVIGDQYFVPGHGKMGGVYVQILGAETLKAGAPVSLGWWWGLFAGLIFAAFAASQSRQAYQNLIFATGVVGFFGVPLLLESNLIFVDSTLGLFVMTGVWVSIGWRGLRNRGLVNAVSGLPNLNALCNHRAGADQAIIAVRVLNYAEVVASLPSDREHQLVEQICSRLRVGQPDRVLYQGDGGMFAWFEDAKSPFAHHIEALHALFRNPAKVSEMSIDLAVAFGVEVGSGRSLSSRLASALVAAEEAAHDGLKWKYHDPHSLQDASWKLSMLSQLDSAIDDGQVWVAYQPKLDLATNQIIGAEALARWTHPTKGPIAATEFVAAAEQHDRIGKLTDFVLEHAVRTAAAINNRGTKFNIAVNLSARLLADKSFTLRLSALLARHKLDPGNLTLELTETAALTGSGEAVDMLVRLRELGIGVSIDDYGTGLSTLDYLKKIPANEIKIDQSFVRAMVENRSDRLMVQSTIALAHSLGRKVVAEGVEQRDILNTLAEMKCDVAQGFIVGRPMSVESLVKRIGSDRNRRVA